MPSSKPIKALLALCAAAPLAAASDAKLAAAGNKQEFLKNNLSNCSSPDVCKMESPEDGVSPESSEDGESPEDGVSPESSEDGVSPERAHIFQRALRGRAQLSAENLRWSLAHWIPIPQ
jgi:hypothetical protein